MQKSKHLWRGLFFILLITALCGGLALPVVNTRARAAPQMQVVSHMVISQVYGGGGNSGSTFTNDFIELFNASDTPIDITGWSVQYASATDGTWSVTNLTNITLQPGQYYLVQEAAGSGGTTPLPTPDASGSIAMNASAGKVALVNTTTALSGAAPSGPNIIDLVGYGTSASVFEGSGPAPAPSATVADIRGMSGCVDTDNNNADFVTGAPNPRNTTVVPILTCGDALTATAVNATGTASAVNATGTSIAQTSTSAALTGTPTNTPVTPTITNTPTIGSANSVVISEFRTRGTGSAENEFVEIYNPTGTAVDISNWILSASNIGGTVQNRATIPVGTLLRSGQYYLFAHNSYVTPSGGVSPNLRYGTSITNDGGVAILNASGDIIDQVGMSEGSFYQEGATLPAFTGSSNGSYERLDGGDLDSCVDTDDNESDFQDSDSGTLHNYSSPLSLCGTDRPALISTTTLITGDTPDPSNINGNVAVSVRVTGSSLSPSGSRVYITGANTNCTITLNSSGTGSCLVKFTTTGTKIITATYLGDNTHQGSSDTETHQVGTSSAIRTPTRVPTAIPPPPLIGINEFVPRPGHDWNNDGVINTGDEYIELINHGVIDVDLSGYSLDDEVNIGSAPFRLSSIILKPGERRVFYGSETGLLLSDGGDGVRLLKPNGQLGDAYNYRVVRFPDQSYCRLPDNGGLDDWNQNCFPTPGLQNSLSGSTVNPPTSGDAENLCPIADTLPTDFVFAECLPLGNNIWNPAYWDRNGWYGERNLPQSPGKWNVFVD